MKVSKSNKRSGVTHTNTNPHLSAVTESLILSIRATDRTSDKRMDRQTNWCTQVSRLQKFSDILSVTRIHISLDVLYFYTLSSCTFVSMLKQRKKEPGSHAHKQIHKYKYYQNHQRAKEKQQKKNDRSSDIRVA